MIWKNFKFNNQTISRKTQDYQIALKDVNWYKLDVSDEQHNIQGFHWIKVSPTYARWRRIEIQGLLLADTRAWSNKWISFLRNLFALQWTFEKTDFKSFAFTDDNWNNWQIFCKIKEPLDIELMDDDYPGWMPRKWRIVIQAEDPYIYSLETHQVYWLEWFYWWVKIWTKLWTKLNEYYNEIQVVNQWNVASPLKITLNVSKQVNKPLKIRNIITWKRFWLDIDANSGDTIVIDSKKHTATKNWENILAYRIEGSYWPKANPGENYFFIYDLDWWLYESDVNIEIQYNDTLL